MNCAAVGKQHRAASFKAKVVVERNGNIRVGGPGVRGRSVSLRGERVAIDHQNGAVAQLDPRRFIVDSKATRPRRVQIGDWVVDDIRAQRSRDQRLQHPPVWQHLRVCIGDISARRRRRGPCVGERVVDLGVGQPSAVFAARHIHATILEHLRREVVARLAHRRERGPSSRDVTALGVGAEPNPAVAQSASRSSLHFAHDGSVGKQQHRAATRRRAESGDGVPSWAEGAATERGGGCGERDQKRSEMLYGP